LGAIFGYLRYVKHLHIYIRLVDKRIALVHDHKGECLCVWWDGVSEAETQVANQTWIEADWCDGPDMFMVKDNVLHQVQPPRPIMI